MNYGSLKALLIRKSGFTLVELLVAVVLGIFLVGGAIQIFVSGKAAYNEMQRLGELQSEIRHLSDIITKDLRAAEGVEPISAGAPVTAFQVIRSGGQIGDRNCAGGDKSGDAQETAILNEYEFDGSDLVCRGLQNGTLPLESRIFDTIVLSQSVTGMTVRAFGKDAVASTTPTALPLADWASARAVEIALTIGTGGNAQTVSFLVSLRNKILVDYAGGSS
jgi:prepilin-type N-terminal cleavage/methylation domain-containing protein